jgi:hypothetical protein
MGWASESQSAIWIPVGRIEADGDGAPRVEELLMFTPYMWVDNPISLASGREIYGFPKAFAWFDLPASDDDATDLGLDVMGIEHFEHDEPLARRPLLRVQQGEHVHELAGIAWSSLLHVVEHVRRIGTSGHGVSLRNGLAVAESVIGELHAGGVRQVFLRQLRGIEDGSRASLQQVTAATYRVQRMRAVPLEHEYSIEISPLDSHPLLRELGLQEQMTTRAAFRTESDFVLETGSVIWQASATGAPS